MKRRFRVGALALCVVTMLFGVPAVATAATIIFNTSDSQFDAGVDNQGWWSATAENFNSNDNYFVGESGIHLRRNFFTFDLSALDLTGQIVTAATLEVVRFTYASQDPSETIEFFDVSTPAATLNNNTGTSAAIFADLGSGTSYGSFVVNAYTSSSLETLSFLLNANALGDITAAAGGFFSIGGALTSITPGGVGIEGLFGVSGSFGTQRLILQTAPVPVPEPTGLLLFGSALIGAGIRRYRRQ